MIYCENIAKIGIEKKSNYGDQGNFKNDENFCDNVESYQKFLIEIW